MKSSLRLSWLLMMPRLLCDGMVQSANRKILSTKHLFKKLRAFTASFEVSENVLSKFSREDLIQFGVPSKGPTDLSTGSAAGFQSDDDEEKGGADAANTSAIGKDGVQRKAADDNRSDNKGEGQDADVSCIHNTIPASPKTIAPNRASVQGANFYEAGWWWQIELKGHSELTPICRHFFPVARSVAVYAVKVTGALGNLSRIGRGLIYFLVS